MRPYPVMTAEEYRNLAGNVPESVIQKQIKQYLELRGWLVWKNHQSLGSVRGVADLTAIKNGITVWIEVKTPRGRQSKEQIRFQEKVEAAGSLYIVARSIEDVMCLENLVLIFPGLDKGSSAMSIPKGMRLEVLK